MPIEAALYRPVVLNSEAPNSASEPFFVNTAIPFPETSHTESYQKAIALLQNNWVLAQEDFVQIYRSEGYGDPLRTFFTENANGGQFGLRQLGVLVKQDSQEVTSQVRRILQLGTNVSDDPGLAAWSFSEVEVAQFLVGIVGSTNRNIYNELCGRNNRNR